MYIKIGGQTYPCMDYRPGAETISFALNGAVPETLGETVELCDDDGFVMVKQTVADWMRWEVYGNALILTNAPVPEPIPEPVGPTIDPLTMTQLAVAELAQTIEDNNTATQLAIAELAEALLGGAT